MQLLKISFIVTLLISLCSFAVLSTQEDGKEQLYKDFLSKFKQINLPNEVMLRANIPQLRALENGAEAQTELKEEPVVDPSILDSKYDEFILEIGLGMMSRMGPSTYRAVLALASSGKYSAVVYSESRSFDGGALSYKLATFDATGKPIASRYLGYAGLEEQVKLKVTEKMELTVHAMVAQEGSEEYRVKDTKKMFITPKGEILVHNEVKPSKIKPLQKSVKSKFTSL